MAAVAEATIDRWFTTPGQQRLPEEVDKVRQMVLSTPVEGFCACCEAIKGMDQRESDTQAEIKNLRPKSRR